MKSLDLSIVDLSANKSKREIGKHGGSSSGGN
jgi:hypothetical protein